jgi:hypothetical protein
MSVPEEVMLFLRSRVNTRFCDNCIAKELLLKKPQQSQQATSALNLAGSTFARGPGKCIVCGKTKLVIRATR